MGKAAWVAPLYLSVAWTLLVSYQMFTQTAVTTLVAYVNMFWPVVGAWLISKVGMIVFISAFAWVFVLSSVIPTVILGKERSVLVQFFVCLALTFFAFIAFDILKAYEGGLIGYLLSLTVLLNNPFLAIVYLAMPYVLMLVIDLRTRKKNKKEKALERVAEIYMQDAMRAEQTSSTKDQQ
ncbi:MAG: hypothetical protein ACPLKQ_01300 [Candidatus Bathyarchaeales archaeon]